MDLKNKTALVLGGWGLVGSAICRRLAAESPKQIIVTSLIQSEAEDAAQTLHKEFPSIVFTPKWGNIFVRNTLKDIARGTVLADNNRRSQLLHDIIDDLTDDIMHTSALYQLLDESKPDCVVDCINTATAIAYQDVYSSARMIMNDLDANRPLQREAIERLLASMYIPQLIRHIQILYQGLHDAGTSVYLKIGTSGTGGMGLNIPYTHSEERPSRVLLSKTSVAGAQSLLLFLMARSPDAPITKEIKPTATIAWKRIGYDTILKRGAPIPLVDSPNPADISNTLNISTTDEGIPLGRNLRAVFIDTGENGIFSRGEFETISSLGQMEMITPEDIAENTVREIKGGNTGADIISALDGSVSGPTYRGGIMRSMALQKLEQLEKENHSRSIAFEMLGPPRLSKLLYEAHILGLACVSMRNILATDAEAISLTVEKVIQSDADLRATIISIEIPILLRDGKSLIRGNSIKIPPFRGENILQTNESTINDWASQGWVDLRAQNIRAWQERIGKIIETTEQISHHNQEGSQEMRTTQYWENFSTVPVAKLASWIFAVEDNGERMKP